MSKGSVFITGGAGFIGSHVAESLLEKGYEVTIYDNLSFGDLENIRHFQDDLKFIEGDILDFRKLQQAMKGSDYVSHHAAELEILKATFNPEHDLQINTIGTLNVLKSAQTAGVKKVINISSACVYGQPEYLPQDEDHPHNPNWAYGVSKLAAEKYAQIFSQQYGIPTTSLRYSIVYGPREWYRRVLTIFIKRIINNQAPVIFDKGEEYRDFIYVKDVVELHNKALESKVANNHVYNVGTGKKTTVRELAEVVLQAAGSRIKPVFEQVKEGETSKIVEGKKRNSQDLEGMCLSYSKAKNELDWKPTTTLLEGVTMTLEWYKKNQNRWNEILYTG